MANVSQRRRFKYFHTSDLPYTDRVCVLVVHGLETVMEDVKDDRGFKIGEEPVHLMHFVGYPKGLRLNNTRLDALAAILGPETDHWVGRKVGLQVAPVTKWGKSELDVVIYMASVDAYEPTPPVSRQFAAAVAATKPAPAGPMLTQGYPGMGPSGYSAYGAAPGAPVPAAFDSRPLGKANAANFQAALAEQGRTFDDWLVWLKSWDPTMHARAWGLQLEDLPRGLVAFMQLYLRDHASGSPSPEAPVSFGQGRPAAPTDAPSAGGAGGPPAGGASPAAGFRPIPGASHAAATPGPGGPPAAGAAAEAWMAGAPHSPATAPASPLPSHPAAPPASPPRSTLRIEQGGGATQTDGFAPLTEDDIPF